MKTKYLAILAGVAVALYALKKSNKENSNNSGNNNGIEREKIKPDAPTPSNPYGGNISTLRQQAEQAGMPSNFPDGWVFFANEASKGDEFILCQEHGKIKQLDILDYFDSGILFVVYEDGFTQRMKWDYAVDKFIEVALFDKAKITFYPRDYIDWIFEEWDDPKFDRAVYDKLWRILYVYK